MLLGIMHADPPYRNLHWYPLTSRKNIWPKLAWFQSIFTVGGWRMYHFKLLLCPLHTHQHRVVKELHS